jgi:hypothetical protein
MVQTLPNYSSLSMPPAPPPLLFCELGLSFFETVRQDLSAKLGGLRLPLRLGLLLGFPELVFASLVHFYLQAFP